MNITKFERAEADFDEYLRKLEWIYNNLHVRDALPVLRNLMPEWCADKFRTSADRRLMVLVDASGRPWRGHVIAFEYERLECIIVAPNGDDAPHDRYGGFLTFWDDNEASIFNQEKNPKPSSTTIHDYARLITRIRDAYVADYSQLLTSRVA